MECYFDEISKNKMIIVDLNEEKRSIEIRIMEEGKEENMRLNRKVEIELKHFEFNQKEMLQKICYKMTPKDNYLILYLKGFNSSKWLYYINMDTGEAVGKSEIDGELWSTCVFCISKSNDIICYSNVPQSSIYYLEFNANIQQKLNKRQLINGNKKYKGEIRIDKQNEFLIVKDKNHFEIYREDDLKRNGLDKPYFEANLTGWSELTSIKNEYLLFSRNESEFLVYKLNQFNKPLTTIKKEVRQYSVSPNSKYLIIGTKNSELIVYKLNDSSSDPIITQFAYIQLNEWIRQILSSDQYIYIRLDPSNRLLTFKIND